jgi:superfamily II DNA or RNA helicase
MLTTRLTIDDPDKFRSREFQLGLWDGKHRFFNEMTKTIPAGLVWFVEDELEGQCDVEVVVPNRRTFPRPDPNILNGITLRDYQLDALERMLASGRGVVRSPPRSGKTVMQAAMCAILDVPSLLLVDRIRLMEQHYKLFQNAGIKDVTMLGGGRHDLGKHVIATVQTVHKGLTEGRAWALDLLRTRELLLVDEAHHQVSRTYLEITGKCNAPWRFGLSGTPFHDRGTRLRPIDISSKYLRSRGYLADPKIYMGQVKEPKFWDNDFQSAYRRGITDNQQRNDLILSVARRLAADKRNTLLLVARIAHGERLLRGLHKAGIRAAFTWSGSTVSTVNATGNVVRERKTHARLMTEFSEGQIQVLIGSQVLDEGIDIPYVDAVIIAGGMKSPIKVIQRAFRGMTAHAGKLDTLIFDFVDDTHAFLRRHSKERIASYVAEEMDVELDIPALYTGGIADGSRGSGGPATERGSVAGGEANHEAVDLTDVR